MDEPRRRLDPAALVVHGAALAAILGIALFVLYEMRSAPSPAPVAAPDESKLQDAVAEIRKWIEEKRAAPSGQGAGGLLPREPNHVWRYAVTVDPPTWRDIALTYRVPSEGGRLVAYTDFTHAGGKMQFRLGAMQPGDPAHANVRFPGFFLHSAYLPYPLKPGQRVTWGWAWQGRSGGVKQFEGVVKGAERITVPLGTFEAVRIDVVIKYIDNGKLAATSRETIWVAPQAHGIVKIVRDGVAPDEGFRRIVAELAEYR